MKKIIHFSDIHIGYQDVNENCEIKFKEIINNLIFTKQPAADYVILITGDIVEDASKKGIMDTAVNFVNILKNEGYTVLVAPGNHDYGNGVFSNREYVPIFKQKYFNDSNISYPKLDVVNDIEGDFAFIALDSMEEELNFLDRIGADGELGDTQRMKLDIMLNSDVVKNCKYRIIYLHHHPFDTGFFHKLKDSDKLGEIIQKYNCDKSTPYIHALLFGHLHSGKKRNGAWNIPRCYDGGTTTRKMDGPSEHRVIDLSRDARWDYDADFHGNY